MDDDKSDARILKILKENLPLSDHARAEVYRDRNKEMSDIFHKTKLEPEEFEHFIENKKKQRKYFLHPVKMKRRWKRNGWFKRYDIPALSEHGEKEIKKLNKNKYFEKWLSSKRNSIFILGLSFIILSIIFLYAIEVI